MTDLSAVRAYIHGRKEHHLAQMQAYLRQPSVSATGEGIRPCAEMVADFYRELGCTEVELVETAGHPAVWGYYDAGAEKTVAVYGMYDVQPIARPDAWHTPPFGAELVSQRPFPQVCIARGAYNSKGTYRLFLNALESIKAVRGELPVNLMFITDGEEEIGSPHYADVVARYSDRLREADFLLDIEANQNKAGKIIVKLGNKGIVYLELTTSGTAWGRGPHNQSIHSSSKAVVDSPIMRLVQALATLTTADGNHIAIDGLYDDVRRPNAADRNLIHQLAQGFDSNVYGQLWGVDRWVNDVAGADWIEQYLFSPSLNIDGIIGGNKTEGLLTILAPEAKAHLDIRLVPNMKPEKVVDQVRAHLQKHGFDEVTVTVKAAYGWNKTAVTATAVQAALHTYEKYGIEYEVWPLSAGSEPLFLFTQPPLCLPMIRYGLGHGSRNHAPNEYLVVEGDGQVAGLVEIEQAYVDFIYRIAAGK